MFMLNYLIFSTKVLKLKKNLMKLHKILKNLQKKKIYKEGIHLFQLKN